MTTAELEAIARTAVPPVGATGARAVVDHEPGPKPGTGTPRYGVAWITGGRIVSAPIALFDRARDAYRLLDLLTAAPRAARDLASGLGATVQGHGQPGAPIATPAEAVALGTPVTGTPRSQQVVQPAGAGPAEDGRALDLGLDAPSS